MKQVEFPTPAQRAADNVANEALAIVLNPLPAGSIIMWNKSLASIPAGFAFCDGTNGTPDLRGLLLIGTQSDTDPGAIVQI